MVNNLSSNVSDVRKYNKRDIIAICKFQSFNVVTVRTDFIWIPTTTYAYEF